MKNFALISVFLISFYFPVKAQITTDTTKTNVEKDNFSILGENNIATEIDFNKGVSFSPLQLVQGKIPGVAITRAGGNDPLQEAQINIQGVTNFFLTSQPVYVIDGVLLPDAKSIIAEEIESIRILRSIAETIKYGYWGADGVVEITTKKAKTRKKLSLEYSTYGYVERRKKKTDMMNADEFRAQIADWTNRYDELAAKYASFTNFYQNMKDYGASTDWVKEISQNKLSYFHHIAASGALKSTSYYASFDTRNNYSILQKNNSNAYSGNVQLKQTAFKERLQLDIALHATNTKAGRIGKWGNTSMDQFHNNDNSYQYNIFNLAELYNPTAPVYDATGNYSHSEYQFRYNPVQKLNEINNKSRNKNVVSSANLSFKLSNSLKVFAGYSYYNNSYNEESSYLPFDSFLNSSYDTVRATNTHNTFTAGLSYSKTIKGNQIDIGATYQQIKMKQDYNHTQFTFDKSSGVGYQNSRMWNNSDGKAKTIALNLNYNYAQRYFIGGNLCLQPTDYERYKWKTRTCSSVTLAWNLRNERFLRSIRFLDELNLSASWGKNYRMWNNSYEVEHLKENTIGFNAAVLNRRISFSLYHFNRKSKDAVVNLPIRPSSDMYFVQANNGDLQTKGYTATINIIPVQKPNFQWEMNINWAKSSTVLHSPEYAYYASGLYANQNDRKGSIYGYKFAELRDTVGGKGYVIYVYDTNGNKVRMGYTSNQWQGVGTITPNYYFGISNTFRFYNFDVSIAMRGALGLKLCNSKWFDVLSHGNGNLLKEMNNDANLRLVYGTAYNLSQTDYFYENANYLKIDNVEIGYTINSKQKWFSSARFYIAANNLYTFTKYKGDPEMMQTLNTSIYESTNTMNYPYTRIFMAGFKVMF